MTLEFKKIHYRFLYILFILLIIAILLDQMVGSVITRLYFKQESGLMYRTTYAMDSTKAEIVILGTSRANHHYIPHIMEDSLKLTCYNAGRDGASIFYHYAVLKCILLRYKPRIILLEMGSDDLYYSKKDIDRLSVLFPYIYKHPQVRSILELQGSFIHLKMLSRIYQHNSNLLTILIGNMDINKIRMKDYQGYVPAFEIMKDTVFGINHERSRKSDPIKVAFLDSIIYLCQTNHILLHVIPSPIFLKSVNQKTSIAFKNFLGSKGVEFWEYENDTTFIFRPFLFQDMFHLNDQGAHRLTEIISHRLKN